MYHLQRRDCPCRWRIFSRHDLALGSGAEDAEIALFRACSIMLRIGPYWPAANRITPCRPRPWPPLDETITIAELTRDPYPIYKRLRREAPVLRVKSVGRTFLTKAADTKYVKDDAALFSSNDPNTPMRRAFLARTLMRKDHDEHRTERMAMMPALMPKTIDSVWAPLSAGVARQPVKIHRGPLPIHRGPLGVDAHRHEGRQHRHAFGPLRVVVVADQHRLE